MPFFQQNDEILVFLMSFFDVTSLMTLSRQNFCISTFTYDNSLTILKISSSSFKPFRSYSLFFFELYIYIIGFLETLYTSDVTNSGTHSLGYPVLFAYRPQLWKFITFRHLILFTCGFFCWVRMVKEIFFYTLTRRPKNDATGTLRRTL